MNQSEEREFSRMFSVLAATFRVESSTALLEGYWLGLEDMPLEQVRTAVKRALRECKFMPTAFELRSLSGEMPAAVRAVSAWQDLLKAIRKHGAWYSVDFQDRLINATVRALGGWREVCAKEADDLHVWTKKEFERVYGLLAQRGEPQGEEAAHLPGQFEVTNGAGGYLVEAPKKIAMSTLRPMAKPRLVSLPMAEGPDSGDKEAG